MEKDELFDQLKDYLLSEYNIPPDKVSKSSSLLYDFQIYGDDTDDFIDRLIEYFKIEVKEITLSKYFIGDEPFDFLSSIVRFLKQEKNKNKPTITIDDVLKFIKTGILN